MDLITIYQKILVIDEIFTMYHDESASELSNEQITILHTKLLEDRDKLFKILISEVTNDFYFNNHLHYLDNDSFEELMNWDVLSQEDYMS